VGEEGDFVVDVFQRCVAVHVAVCFAVCVLDEDDDFVAHVFNGVLQCVLQCVCCSVRCSVCCNVDHG